MRFYHRYGVHLSYLKGHWMTTKVDAATHHEFEYDERYFQSYGKRKTSIDDIYTRYLNWAGLIDGEGKTALDIGAAFGYVVDLLQRFGYSAYGVDISPFACSKSEDVICGSAETPPFKENFFDLVTCFETIEHLPQADMALARFNGLLRKHGTLIFTTPTPFGEKVHRRFLPHYPYYSDDKGSKPTDADYHAHHPSLRECRIWINALSSAGFVNIKCRQFILTPIILRKYRVLPSLSMSATHMLIRAEKHESD